MHEMPKGFKMCMVDVLVLGHAGVHRLPQQHLVLQPSGGSVGACHGALGHHPQNGCQSQPPGECCPTSLD